MRPPIRVCLCFHKWTANARVMLLGQPCMCYLLMPALSINGVQLQGARPVQLGRQNVKKVACKLRSNSRRVAAGAKLFHTGVNANEEMLQRNSIACSISIR